jgi:hypothetical protein
MKRTIVLVLVLALVLVVFAVPAFAGNGNAYGKTINDSCLDASYGQLISTAIKADHVDKASGAKAFVESGALAAHFGLCPTN